ncbi:nicotinamidase-related amidase [Natronocella acetinitrilica]|uniref:Nicotinamidase-related amidase n=1 Tax=Natronocella acetinitrilica TaxID=414046 RepID=A0AAE3G676_9GAMM|nr:isochorismatase family protein [Natronocella acetinitrilica]MCP1676404.1 nicotinamidase-related amidase [Natronocella acetinitrilica]
MNSVASKTWGRRVGFGASPALVVVDFTIAFTEPGRALGSDVSSAIAATNDLLDVSHASNWPVLFTAIAYSDPNFADAGMWLAKVGGQEDLRAGSDGVDVDPRLNRTAQDTVIIKKYASAFFGTDLSSRLVTSNVDTVLITGCSTSGCVRATAVDAIQHGFRPIVVREAVADRWEDAHKQALKDLDAKYADVVSLQEALEYLQRNSGIEGLVAARD